MRVGVTGLSSTGCNYIKFRENPVHFLHSSIEGLEWSHYTEKNIIFIITWQRVSKMSNIFRKTAITHVEEKLNSWKQSWHRQIIQKIRPWLSVYLTIHLSINSAICILHPDILKTKRETTGHCLTEVNRLTKFEVGWKQFKLLIPAGLFHMEISCSIIGEDLSKIEEGVGIWFWPDLWTWSRKSKF